VFSQEKSEKSRWAKIMTNSMVRRVLAMILAVVMLIGLLPLLEMPASAATTLGGSTTLVNGGDYVFTATSATNRTYTVAANATVKVTVPAGVTVTLNNQAAGGSPFVLQNGATLNLVVNGTMNVYGQNGGAGGGATPSKNDQPGGTAGYAGINVPSGSRINISGSGTLNAYGGRAGNGGDSKGTYSDTMSGGGGGGGAGAGIGGNGGIGDKGNGYNNTGARGGGNGQSAGTIFITGTVRVLARGGGGGSGGSIPANIMHPGGAGGGGYPAAGIGGGGAGGGGGNCGGGRYGGGSGAGGGGGFSGGAGAGRYKTTTSNGGVNGQGGDGGSNDGSNVPQAWAGGGGGYASAGKVVTDSSLGPGSGGRGGALYGGGGAHNDGGGAGGNGGSGGNGGTIYVNNNATKPTVTAQNGSYITNSTSYSATHIRTQSTQGYGTGAGFTESAGGPTYVTTPSAPTVSSGAGTGTSGEMKVTWTVPSGNAISSYTVNVYSDAACTGLVKSTTATTTSATFTGLTNGTTYYVRVRATNIIGDGAWSAAKAVIPYYKPLAPTDVKVVPTANNGELSVSWKTPSNNGNAINKVEILTDGTVRKTISPSSNASEFSSAMTTAGSTASTTVTGLVGGTSYNVTVRVSNNAGGTSSSPAVPGVPSGPPLKTGSVTAEGTGVSGQVKLTWITPNSNGPAITSVEILNADTHQVVDRISDSSNTNLWNTGKENFTTEGRKNEFFINGLANGTLYRYQVRVNNSAGSGVLSDPVQATPYAKPAAPTNVVVTSGVKSLTVSWTAAANNGSAITRYDVYEVVGSTVSAEPVATTSGTSATISGLGVKESHRYVVKATNAAGQGPQSNVADGETFDVPGKLGTQIKAEAVSSTSATVKWQPLPDGDNGGSPVTGYVVSWKYVSPGNSGALGVSGSKSFTLAELGSVGTDGQYTATVTGLIKGVTYNFTVTPVNAVGTGTNSSEEAQARMHDQPAKVTGVEPKRTEKNGKPVSGSVTVSWTEPDNGRSPISIYTVYVYAAKSGDGATAEVGAEITDLRKQVNADQLSTEITGLTNGNTYFFRVSATNAVGESLMSDLKSVIPAYTPGEVPDVLANTMGVTDTETLNVTWGYAQDNGAEITSYRVRLLDAYKNLITIGECQQTTVDGKAADVYTLSSGKTITIVYDAGRKGHSAIVTGLDAGTVYHFEVRAENRFGEGAQGITVKGKATLSVPGKPDSVMVMPTGVEGMFSMKWEEPDNIGGTAITRYQIYMFPAEDNYIAMTPEQLQQEAKKADGFVRFRDLSVEELIQNAKDVFNSDDYTQWVTETAMPTTGGHTTYAVRIAAQNMIGWGEWSDPAEVSAYGTPRAVEDLKAELSFVAGSPMLDVSWTDPSDLENGIKGNGGSEITKYNVEVTRLVNGEKVPVTDYTTSKNHHPNDGGVVVIERVKGPHDDGANQDSNVLQEVTIQGLIPGETYYVSVKAVNEGGPSAYGNVTPGVTIWTLPTQGAFVTVTPTNATGELRVQWYKSEDDGDKPENGSQNRTFIDHYTVYYRLKGNNSVFTPKTYEISEGASEPYTMVLSGLEDGQAYEVYVTATNGVGETDVTPETATIASGTPRRPAGAPKIGTLTSGNGAAVLSYLEATPESENGGSPISYYRIYAQAYNGMSYDAPVLVRTVNASGTRMEDITLPNLVNGVQYQITAYAVNGTMMDGEPSNKETVLVGIPEAPTNLKVEPGPRFTAVATFDEANGNGNPILYYLAYVNGELYKEDGQEVHFETNRVEVQADEGGQIVSVAVSAVNRVTESEKTEAIAIKIGTPTTPVLSSVLADSAGVTLRWEGSTNNGITMTGYNIYLKSGDGEWQKLSAPKPGANDLTARLEKTTHNLTSGTVYQVKVTAENLVGESPDSQAMTFQFGVPGAPTITDVQFGDESLTVTFTEPADKGTSNVLTQFKVYANGGEARETFDLSTLGTPDGEGNAYNADKTFWKDSAGAYHVVVKSLANGSEYLVQVSAVNVHGESPLSEPWKETPASSADAPRSVLVEVLSDQEVEVTWKAPLYNGGSGITGYQVNVFDTETNGPVADAQIDIQGLKASVTGLKAGHSYYFVVTALNKAGEGASERSADATTFKKPGEPTIVSWKSYWNVNTASYDLVLNWEAPKDTGGTPITGYKVWLGASLKSGGMLDADERTFTVTGLRAIPYTIRVEAFNSVCDEKKSSYGGGTYTQMNIAVGKLEAPENFRASSPTSDVIKLSWNPVEQKFSFYRVYDLSAIMNANGWTLDQAVAYAESQPNNATGFEINDASATEYELEFQEPGTHYYAIRCFTAQGTGGYLSEVREVTLGGAHAPKLIAVEPGCEELQVSFRMQGEESWNGYPLYGYQVLVNGKPYEGAVKFGSRNLDIDKERHVITDGALRELAAGQTVILTMPELNGNTEYSVTVRAVTVDVDPDTETTTYLSGDYETAQTVTVWTKPTAPVITDTISGNQTFTVHYREADGMGLPIAGYAVFYEGKGDSWLEEPAAEVAADAREITVTGAINGYKSEADKTGWDYRLAAFTEYKGVRYYTTLAKPYPSVVTGIPGAPEITKVTAGNGTVMVYYSAPSMDPTIAVTGYNIYYKTADTDWTMISTNSTATSYQLTGLTNKTPYSIKVQAVNRIGEGAESEVVTAVPGTPGAPEVVDYAPGDQQVTLRWRKPTENGMPLLSYRVYYTDTTDDSEYIMNVDVNLNRVTVTGLTNGHAYDFELVAINGNGEGERSQKLTLTPGTVPGAPRDVQAKVTGGDTIEVSWLAPATDGGLDIDQYRVSGNGVEYTVDVSDPANYVDEEVEGIGTVRRYILKVQYLVPGTTYEFSVSAHNLRDYGETAKSAKVTTFTAPGVPQWRGMSSLNYTFTALWTAPQNNGGTEIEGYNVYVDGELVNTALLKVNNEEDGLFIDERNIISYTAPVPLPNGTKLELGGTYEVSVAAVNAVGESEKTSPMFITIQGAAAESVPGRPGTPVLTAGNQRLTVTWSAPLIEGVVEGLEGYYINYREVSSADGENPNPIKTIWHANTANLTEVITGLTNGTTYEVWVMAKNRMGTSAASAIVQETPQEISAPNKPENMRYQNNAQMTTMTLRWDAAVASAQGGTVYYDIYINNVTDEPTFTTEQLSYALAVVSGVEYRIWIVARNTGGQSPRDVSKPDMIARNSLNVETTGILGAEPNLNLDRDFDGVLDPDQIATKPTTPTDLDASVLGLSQIDLTWKTPEKESVDSQGNTVYIPFTDISYYKIYVNGSEYGTVEATGDESGNKFVYPKNKAVTLAEGDDPAEETGLKPGTIYSFQVSAVNDEGEGDTSVPLQVYVQDSIDPTNLRITDSDYTSVSLAWDAPVSKDGREPTFYVLQINGDDRLTEIPGNVTEYTFQQLVPGRNYVFRIWARYQLESGSEETSKTTNAVSLSTALSAPGVPTELEVTDITGSNITFTWTAPEGAFSYYRLYVDSQLVDLEIPSGATEATYTVDSEGDYSLSLSAVNSVTAQDWDDDGKAKEFTKEGERSASVLATTRAIGADAPAAPMNLHVGSTADGIELIWNAVEQTKNNQPLPDDAKLEYILYISKDGSPLVELSAYDESLSTQPSDVTENSDGTLTYTFVDSNATEVGSVYEFRVCAMIVGGERGEMSNACVVSTVKEYELPEAPMELKASVNEAKTEITLTWKPVAAEGLTGYVIYLDGGKVMEVNLSDVGFDSTAPSYTHEIKKPEKTSFYFQVAAKNLSQKENSLSHVGESELSEGINVSTSGDLSAYPAAAEGPTIVKSIHNQPEKVIRIYWSAPTKDVDGKDLSPSEIYGYRINIVEQQDNGMPGASYLLAENVNHTATNYDSEQGLWYYDIQIENSDYPIELGRKYAVTITATRSYTVNGETGKVPGAAKAAWIIMQNLNLDEDGDWIVDKYPDPTGSGEPVVETGMEVTVTAVVTAGGNGDPTVQVTLADGTSPENITVEYDKDSSLLTAKFRVQVNADGKYTLRLYKPGCTYVELTDVPTIESVKKIDLNAVIGESEITLYTGDADGNGEVGLGDLSTISMHYGEQNVGPEDGDVDGNGEVGLGDLSVVTMNYGKVSITKKWSGTE
jgi:hypothetical protein